MKISKKDIKKQDPCLNQQSKVPIELNLEAKLSFLSSLSCKCIIYILNTMYYSVKDM